MLFDLRGSGRRRTVKIVYITLAFLMGGGLVLFGIGGGGGISGGLVDAITGTSGGGDTSADRFRKQEKAALAKTQGQPAGRCRLGRARPRALPARGRRRELRPREVDVHQEGRRAAQQRGRRVGALSRAEPEEARRPRGEPDGAGVRGAEPARQGGGGPGGHHRRQTHGLDLHPARDLRLPGRPDPQGRPRQEQGARARPTRTCARPSRASSSRPSSRHQGAAAQPSATP